MTNRLFIILAVIVPCMGAGSCTYSVTREKTPVFAGSMDSLGITLNQLVACQHFNVDGKEVTKNKKKNSELELDVINGKDIPVADDSMAALAKKLGRTVKSALRDTAEYEQYRILFVTVKKSGSFTSRSWHGKVFESAELR